MQKYTKLLANKPDTWNIENILQSSQFEISQTHGDTVILESLSVFSRGKQISAAALSTSTSEIIAHQCKRIEE